MRLLVFDAGGLVCAIPAGRVVEVREPAPLTRVPGAPPAAPGVMALRGDVHALLDVAVRLGVAPSAGERPLLVVVEGPETVGACALRVDRILGLEEHDDGALVPAPAAAVVPDVVAGVVVREEGILLVLDVDRLLEPERVKAVRALALAPVQNPDSVSAAAPVPVPRPTPVAIPAPVPVRAPPRVAVATQIPTQIPTPIPTPTAAAIREEPARPERSDGAPAPTRSRGAPLPAPPAPPSAARTAVAAPAFAPPLPAPPIPDAAPAHTAPAPLLHSALPVPSPRPARSTDRRTTRFPLLAAGAATAAAVAAAIALALRAHDAPPHHPLPIAAAARVELPRQPEPAAFAPRPAPPAPAPQPAPEPVAAPAPPPPAVVPASLPTPAAVTATPPRPTPPRIAAPATPAALATHVRVVRGDTLWRLARVHLGDPEAWPRLYAANRDQIADPDLIEPGQELALPPR